MKSKICSDVCKSAFRDGIWHSSKLPRASPILVSLKHSVKYRSLWRIVKLCNVSPTEVANRNSGEVFNGKLDTVSYERYQPRLVLIATRGRENSEGDYMWLISQVQYKISQHSIWDVSVTKTSREMQLGNLKFLNNQVYLSKCAY